MRRLVLTLIFSLYLCGCSTVGVTKIINTDDGYTKLTGIRQFSKKDRQIAEEALSLISKIDPNQSYPHLPQSLYWAKLEKKYAGLTVTFGSDPKTQYKHVYIDRETISLNSNDPIELLHFGALLSHELSHYFHDTDDPYTGQITNEAIYKKITEDPKLLKKLKGFGKR